MHMHMHTRRTYAYETHAYETHEWSRVKERHGTVTKDRFYCTYLFVLLCRCRVECAREVVAGALHHLLCSCIHL